MIPNTQPFSTAPSDDNHSYKKKKVIVDLNALEHKKKKAEEKDNKREEKKEELKLDHEITKRDKKLDEALLQHKRPITRERQIETKEKKRDEKEMAQKVPLIKRIQRKEEEALGTADSKKSFLQTLIKLEDRPDTILLKMKTVFPFDFFPNTITIDPIKVQIHDRYFFSSQQVQSILIKDVITAYVEEGPILATLKIEVSDDKKHPVRISYLKKNEARKARKIIQGLVISRSESPDINKLESIR